MTYVDSADLASTAPGKGASLVGFIQAGTGAVADTAWMKLSEQTISIADFGAVSDNTTDDTSAIIAAVAAASAAGRTLSIPAGTTVVSSAISLPNNLCIIGEGKYQSKIRASGSHPVFTNSDTSTPKHVQIKGISILDGTYGT